MTTTFTWRILGTRCIPLEGQFYDVINWSQWECLGVETDNETYYKEASDVGEMDFVLDPQAPYVPRDEITDETILNWIWSGGVNKEAVEADVQAKLNSQ